MSIENQPSRPIRSNPARTGEAGKAQQSAKQASGAERTGAAASAGEAAPADDSVEISSAARKEAQSTTGTDAADGLLVERGREALGTSSLSEGRLAELRQRVADGYYTEPEATERIAEGVAEDLDV